MKKTICLLLAVTTVLIWFESAGRPAVGNDAAVQSCSSTALQLIPADETPLANPVWYDHACYWITGTSNGRHLYRVAPGAVTNWNLPFPITANSFAAVTDKGSLRILTENAIASCDLQRFGDRRALASTNATITFNVEETPAMGPDGSLYFRNSGTNGSIVAYSSSLQQNWQTKLKFNRISPITVSASGQHVWVLGEIDVQDSKETRKMALVRIDAATGGTATTEIKNEPAQNSKPVFPLLTTFFQPAVASSSNKDYVFVAGNTYDTGLLQLMRFEPGTNPPVVLWTRLGKVTTPPALRVAENSKLFVFEDNSIAAYPWDSSKGRYQDSAASESISIGRPGALLADGANAFYVLGVRQEIEDQQLAARLEPIIKKIDERNLELSKVTERLAQQDQALVELKGQIMRGTTWLTWTLVIAGVMMGACLLLGYWILRSRPEKMQRVSV